MDDNQVFGIPIVVTDQRVTLAREGDVGINRAHCAKIIIEIVKDEVRPAPRPKAMGQSQVG